MNQNHHGQPPVLQMHFEKDERQRYLLCCENEKQAVLDGAQLVIHIAGMEDIPERWFPVFQQKAHNYQEYSEYMEHHGCACCSLTTILAAFGDNMDKLRPEETIRSIERSCFTDQIWENNYGKRMAKQMPVSLYGISQILRHYRIAHRYVRRLEGVDAIRTHLYRGQPIIVETSRVRKKNGMIVSINDKKYAGSYHTMILLGIGKDGEVYFTDSATRQWADSWQRLKKAPLEDMMGYMFGQRNTKDTQVYFGGRRNTGGYILIDERER